MKQKKIYVTEESINLRGEFRNYKWVIDKNGQLGKEPVDAYNHGIDASRYGVTMTMGGSRFFLGSV